MPTGHPGTFTERKRPVMLSIRGTAEEIDAIKRRANPEGPSKPNGAKIDRYVIAAALGAPIPAARPTKAQKETPRITFLREVLELKNEIHRLRGEIARQGGLLKSLYVRDSETLRLADRDSEQLAEIRAHISAEATAAQMMLDKIEALRITIGQSMGDR